MLVFFMKVKNIDDIPAPRIKRFWQEIDIDQSGAVSFSEYVHWSAVAETGKFCKRFGGLVLG